MEINEEILTLISDNSIGNEMPNKRNNNFITRNIKTIQKNSTCWCCKQFMNIFEIHYVQKYVLRVIYILTFKLYYKI